MKMKLEALRTRVSLQPQRAQNSMTKQSCLFHPSIKWRECQEKKRGKFVCSEMEEWPKHLLGKVVNGYWWEMFRAKLIQKSITQETSISLQESMTTSSISRTIQVFQRNYLSMMEKIHWLQQRNSWSGKECTWTTKIRLDSTSWKILGLQER